MVSPASNANTYSVIQGPCGLGLKLLVEGCALTNAPGSPGSLACGYVLAAGTSTLASPLLGSLPCFQAGSCVSPALWEHSLNSS